MKVTRNGSKMFKKYLYSFVLNCSRGLYCIFSNFSPQNSFQNEPPILPKCEIMTYLSHFLFHSPPPPSPTPPSPPILGYFSFHKTELFLRTKSKNKYQVGKNNHLLKMSKALLSSCSLLFSSKSICCEIIQFYF